MNSNPSLDPANTKTLAGTFQTAFLKFIQSIDGMIPGRVVAYDKDTNRAQIQPLIQLLDTNNNSINRAPIAQVPVAQWGAGGLILNFPVKTGDLGLLFAADRDISIFLQSYNDSRVQTLRIKNFADSFFIPNVMTGYTIAEEDSENAVLQTLDGTVKISIGATGINILTSTQPITVTAQTAQINATESITCTSPKVRIDAATNVIMTTPLLAVSGNITAGGTITPLTPPPPP